MAKLSLGRRDGLDWWHRGRESGAPGEHGQPAELERFERLERPLMAILPYAMLAVSLLATASVPATRPALPLVLILSATAAAWTGWMFALHPAWRERRGLMAVFLVVLLALAAALVTLDPWFGFFAFSCYFYAFWVTAGWWRAVAVCIVAVIVGTSQAGGPPGVGKEPVAGWVLICLVNIVVGGGFFWFGAHSDAQSERRKDLVAELSDANRKLEGTLRENAGLQAQLVAQAREAGVADERQRMAREIHDTIAQGLAGIVTQLQAADRAGQAGPDSERRRHLDAAIELARDSLAEARRSVYALRPEALQSGQVRDALNHVARRWAALHRIDAEVTMTGTLVPLPPEAEVVLLRVAQEALANVAKHARATRARLTLSYMEDLVTLDICDDGTGFVTGGSGPAGQPGQGRLDGGFGLTGMRERLQEIGGTLEIESEPGSGTVISASLPVSCRRSGAAAAGPDQADVPRGGPGQASRDPAAGGVPVLSGRRAASGS
jgi:signal transduction histidine kinase